MPSLALFFSCRPMQNSEYPSIRDITEKPWPRRPVNLARIDRKQQQLQSWLERLRRDRLFPSMTAGVVTDGVLSYEVYINSRPDMHYGVASITKTITATAVMVEVQAGRIELDAPISQYLPGVQIARPELGSDPVTIRHLLTHASGLPDFRYYRSPYNQEITGLPFDLPQQIVPAGRHYRYSNHNFMLLGVLLERISGSPLPQYLQEHVFEPAGMNSTFMVDSGTGAGGVRTTLPDLANYAIYYLSGGSDKLNAQSIHMMIEEQIYIPQGRSRKYVGLGWRVESDEQGVITFFHIGGANGISAWVQMFPRYNCAVVYLGNPPSYNDRLMANLFRLQGRLADLATAMTGASPAIYNFEADKVDLTDPDVAGVFTGRYRDPVNGEVIEIQRQGHNLTFRNRREGNVILIPDTMHIFLGRHNYLTYDFVFNREDRLLGLATHYGYYERLTEIAEE